MKKQHARFVYKTLLTIIVSSVSVVSNLNADPYTITLGDIDGGVYNGPGSVDHLYCDPEWWASVYPNGSPTETDRLDSWVADRGTTFTFLFEPGNITEAYLRIALRALRNDVVTDYVLLENFPADAYYYTDLGFSYSFSEFTVNTLDLSDVCGTNYLDDMADGKLNIVMGDDSCFDYVMLTVNPVPLPAAVLLGMLGLGTAGWRLKKREAE